MADLIRFGPWKHWATLDIREDSDARHLCNECLDKIFESKE